MSTELLKAFNASFILAMIEARILAMGLQKGKEEMEELFINMAFSVLISSVKNPARKAQFKAACLKLYRLLKTEFAGDPDFA